jgi:CBS domain-containing protein
MAARTRSPMARPLPGPRTMARSVAEIMNRELLAVVPETPAQTIRELLRTFAISCVPVLDDERRPVGTVTACAVLDRDGTACERMSSPAICMDGSASFEAAARHLVLEDAHHLVVVDSAGVAVGIVSVLDLVRAMLGVPARHPATFPHWNPDTKSSWTDEWPLDAEHLSQVPDAPGVLVLVRGRVGETDAIVWAEDCGNVRRRVFAMTAGALSGEPALAQLSERYDLRFRACAVRDEGERKRITSSLRSQLEHRPPPGAT